ncbi:MAG: glycosyltransferase family 1 protein [Candidatus Curtissbacteria bacterium]|nr:glycosyltransferase family 1 protein [Candidatus Curtissbacteria bacterium]
MKISRAFLRIGIDARFIGPEGTGLGKYTEKLILNIAKLDRKNKYVIFLGKRNWDFFEKLPKNFTRSLADVPWYSLSEQIKMPKIIVSENLDLLHVPHFNVPIFYSGKFIVTVHDLIHHKFAEHTATTKNPAIFKLKRLAYKKVIEHAIRKSSKIITPSNFVRGDIIKTFSVDPNKIVVTYEAAEEEYENVSSIKYKVSSKNANIIYVGNAYPHKNLNNLLDAIKLLVHGSQFIVHRNSKTVNSQPSTVNLKLILVCPRDVFWERLKEEIKKRNLEKNVVLKGYLKAEDLKKLFQKSSAYVFPSLSEGFGIPGLNAMSSGLPVIASDIPVLKEVYGDAAFYFDPKNPKDIAEKIDKVLINPKLRQKLIEAGFKQSLKYSWLKMAQETLKVYESVK